MKKISPVVMIILLALFFVISCTKQDLKGFEYDSKVYYSYSECQKISDDYHESECLHELAFQKKDVNGCFLMAPFIELNVTEDGEQVTYAQDRILCFFDIARVTGDYTVCENIEKQEKRDWISLSEEKINCIEQPILRKAIDDENPEICLNLSLDASKYGCANSVAEIIMNYSICENEEIKRIEATPFFNNTNGCLSSSYWAKAIKENNASQCDLLLNLGRDNLEVQDCKSNLPN